MLEVSYYTIDQASKLLQISESTFRRGDENRKDTKSVQTIILIKEQMKVRVDEQAYKQGPQ